MSTDKKSKSLSLQPFSFRVDLLRQQPSQIDLAYSDIQKTVLELEAEAQRLGGKLGVRHGPIELAKPQAAPGSTEALLIALRPMIEKIHRYSIDRVNGAWGLWYSPSGQGTASPVLLRDAPIEARALFLQHSEEFFRGYLTAAQQMLASPKNAVDAGQRTLDMLRNIEER